MALTAALNEIVVPQVFTPHVLLEASAKSRLIQSGAVQENSAMNSFLQNGGDVISMPFLNDLDRVEANASNLDDLSVTPNIGKITAGKSMAHRIAKNKAWTASDMQQQLSGINPFTSVADRVARYWAYDTNMSILKSLDGIFKTGGAGASATFVLDKTGVALTANHVIDVNSLMGDNMGELSTIVVHPIIYASMLKLNMVSTTPDSEERLGLRTFMGQNIVVDANVPVISGTPNSYVCYVIGGGAVQFAMQPAENATEVERNARGGNGGGVDTLHSRYDYALAVQGFSYTAAYTGTPLYTNLNTAANWTKVISDDNAIRIRKLIVAA